LIETQVGIKKAEDSNLEVLSIRKLCSVEYMYLLDRLYIHLPPLTHQGAFQGQNRDGAPSSKANNTSDAVVNPNNTISTKLR